MVDTADSSIIPVDLISLTQSDTFLQITANIGGNRSILVIKAKEGKIPTNIMEENHLVASVIQEMILFQIPTSHLFREQIFSISLTNEVSIT